MEKKVLIRKKYLLKRKNNFHYVKKNFFNPLIQLLKKKRKNKKINLAIYYPTSYELDILKVLDAKYFKKVKLLLPAVEDQNLMHFYGWKKNDIMALNKFGIPEPIKSQVVIPNVILVPLLAFDNKKNRLGYGKGFYDRFLKKIHKIYKNIITIGVAFSFQKHHNLPVNRKDFKLDFIITEKGII